MKINCKIAKLPKLFQQQKAFETHSSPGYKFRIRLQEKMTLYIYEHGMYFVSKIVLTYCEKKLF